MERTQIESILEKLYFITDAKEYFEPPEMKIASAADPFFQQFKTIIGEHHWTPQEIVPDAKSVICWFMPAGINARKTNRQETSRPSMLWARVRSYGELANEQIRHQLCRHLENAGYQAVAPHLRQCRQGLDIQAMGYSSHWSERHASFVAGLGTFGLSAGLITEHGVAGRFGTVVTSLKLVPDSRPYGDDPFAWCNRCGACIRRCPAHAIGQKISDRDKNACATYIMNHIVPGRIEHYGWSDLSLGCGLCQTAVPCEFQVP